MALNPRIENWSGRRVWLIGASSGIGRALASALHARGAKVIVSARNHGALADFVRQHDGAVSVPVDVTVAADVQVAAQGVLAAGSLDCVVYCAGYYRAMSAQTMQLSEMLDHCQINYVGALHVLDAILPYFLGRTNTESEAAPSVAHISLMASVAGYRGLPKSLAYGPTKAALINLAETLYLDLRANGIAVSVINPGFVNTRLTAANTFKMPALLNPEQAADAILRGWARGRFEIHFPWRFTLWLKLLQCLPYRASFAITRRLNP